MKKTILTLLVALPMSVFAQKFAHFNSAEIIQAMPEYTAAQTELQAQQKQVEDEAKRMEDELRTKFEDYQKNEATMVDAVKTRRQQELEDLQTRYQQYLQTSQQDLQKLSSTKMQTISEKLGKVVKEVGVAGGYVYIMDIKLSLSMIISMLSTRMG